MNFPLPKHVHFFAEVQVHNHPHTPILPAMYYLMSRIRFENWQERFVLSSVDVPS